MSASTGNWTYEEVRRIVVTELEIEQKPEVSLDVSRADYMNVRNIVAWAASMGYNAEEHDRSETVLVRKHVDTDWPPKNLHINK